MKIIKLIVLEVFLLASLGSFAQLAAIRDLQRRLPSIRDSSEYVDALNKLGLLCYQKSWDSCYYYGKKANDIATRLHYTSGLAGSFNVLGIYYISSNQYLATGYFDRSLQLYRRLGDTAGIGNIYNNMAGLSSFNNDAEATIQYVRLANKTTQTLRNDSVRALILNSLVWYDTTLSHAGADSLLQQGIRISRKYRDTLTGRFLVFERLILESRYARESNIVQRLEILAGSVLADEANYLLANIYSTIGDVLIEKGPRDTVLYYYTLALQRARMNDNHPLIVIMLESLKQAYVTAGDYKNAFRYAAMVSQEKEKQQELIKQSGYTYANFIVREKDLQLAQARSAAQTRIIVISATLLCVLIVLTVAVFRQNTRLHSWNRFHDMLLGIMAHDLRQPFAAIVTLTEFTQMDDSLSYDILKKMLLQLNEVSAQSIQFMDGLLRWLKSKREDFTYTPQPVSIEEAVMEANVFFISEQHKKGIRLEMARPPVDVLRADRVMLQFILRNILNNATRYSPQNSIIHIGISEMDSNTVIAIADQGPGMSQEKMAALFSARNTGPHHAESSNSAGLALVICREMAKLMRGSLTAESVEGEGTTFRLALPAAV